MYLVTGLLAVNLTPKSNLTLSHSMSRTPFKSFKIGQRRTNNVRAIGHFHDPKSVEYQQLYSKAGSRIRNDGFPPPCALPTSAQQGATQSMQPLTTMSSVHEYDRMIAKRQQVFSGDANNPTFSVRIPGNDVPLMPVAHLRGVDYATPEGNGLNDAGVAYGNDVITTTQIHAQILQNHLHQSKAKQPFRCRGCGHVMFLPPSLPSHGQGSDPLQVNIQKGRSEKLSNCKSCGTELSFENTQWLVDYVHRQLHTQKYSPHSSKARNNNERYTQAKKYRSKGILRLMR